jgi:atypical dual specificity phosphatase
MSAPNFSFVLPGRLAGLADPGRGPELEQTLAVLREHGVGGLVSLTQEPPGVDALARAGIEPLHLPVPDFAAPTIRQVTHFALFVDRLTGRDQAVAVHCGAGQGRTGTMLACYLVHEGAAPAEAIRRVRALRPGSVETLEQEDAIYRYAESLGRNRSSR